MRELGGDRLTTDSSSRRTPGSRGGESLSVLPLDPGVRRGEGGRGEPWGTLGFPQVFSTIRHVLLDRF